MEQTMISPAQLVQETIDVCSRLIQLLTQENAALEQRDVKSVEHHLKEKSKLVAQLERRLSMLKTHNDKIKTDSLAHTLLKKLQQALDAYNTLARKNLLKLQAMHQSTASFLMAIRDAVAAQQPRSNAYNQSGKLAETTPDAPSFVNKNI